MADGATGALVYLTQQQLPRSTTVLEHSDHMQDRAQNQDIPDNPGQKSHMNSRDKPRVANVFSRTLDPFYFTTRRSDLPICSIRLRAEVLDNCVQWSQEYVNPAIKYDTGTDKDAQWDINQKYSKETKEDAANTATEERNPDGRTGLRDNLFLPQKGVNTIFHLVITCNAQMSERNQPSQTQGAATSKYRKVLVCKKNTSSPDDWWASPHGKWSLPVLDSTDARKHSDLKSLLGGIFKDSNFFSEEFIKDFSGQFVSWKSMQSTYETKMYLDVSRENMDESNFYLDDPRNTDFAWLKASVFSCDIGYIKLFRDEQGKNTKKAEDELDKNTEQPELGDNSFRWINFDESVNSSNDVFSSSRIVINHCILNATEETKKTLQQNTRTPQDHDAAPVLRTLKFQGNPAICKFVKILGSESKSCDAICDLLFSGPRPDIGWWSHQNYKKHPPHNETVSDAKQVWMPYGIISVTGGAQDFRMCSKPADEALLIDKIFKDGILKAAVSMRALIVDGGFSAGVMKQLGRAVAEDGNRVAILGICPWGAISERSQIDPQISGAACTYQYRIDAGHQNSAFSAALDENHRYFALIDSHDVGESAWGTEIDMRYGIECALSRTPPKSPDVPHVLVVVNGGVGTIETVHKLSAGITDAKNPSTKNSQRIHLPKTGKRVPIVVVEGSGKAADFIACTWRHFHGEASSHVTQDSRAVKDKIDCRLCMGPGCVYSTCVILSSYTTLEKVECQYLKARFEEYFGTSVSKEDYEKRLKQVVEACVRKEAITIYNFNDTNSLSHAILQGVCKGTIQSNGQPYTANQRMCLLEKWNSPEAAKIARTEVFNGSGQELKPTELQNLLFSSLIHNRVVFVELLLDFEVELERKYLNDLYSHGENSHSRETFADENDLALERYAPNLRVLNLVRKLDMRAHSYKHDIQYSSPAPATQLSCTTPAAALSVTEDNFAFQKLVLHFMGWEQISIWGEAGAGPAGTAGVPATHFLLGNGDRGVGEGGGKSTSAAATAAGVAGAAGAAGAAKGKEEGVNREDLFLWAILTGRLHLAELFWRRCGPELRQHSITRALFACAISRTIGSRLPPVARRLLCADNQDPEKHPNIADHFETIACKILDLCYRKSRNKAVSILKIPMVHCSKKIWMDRRFRSSFMNSQFDSAMFLDAISLACDAEAHHFASHDAVQACLDEIWTGRIMVSDDDQVLLSKEQELGLSDPKGLRFRHQGILSFIPTDGYFMELKVYKANLDVLLSAFLIVPVLLMKDSSDHLRSDASWEEMFISWGEKLSAFYSSPMTKFWLDFASYLTFLLLYTYVGFSMDYEFSQLEILVNFWILALVLREFWEYIWDGKRYYKAINNIYDVVMLIFYIPAISMRFNEHWCMDRTSYNAVGGFLQSNGTLEALQNSTLAVYQSNGEDFLKARSWHGMAGILFWVRLSDFFRVSEKLGPLTQVLLKVSSDALFFFLFLLVFIIPFGSAIICAGRPRADPGVPLYMLIEQAVYLPYMAIFGEHYLNGVSVSSNNNPACDLERDSSCSSRPKLGIILYALYLFVSTVVLLNLLIASKPRCPSK